MVAGRAGRAELPGEVIVQTFHEDAPAIHFATNHDYDGFAAWEMPSRKKTHLPPYSRMISAVSQCSETEMLRSPLLKQKRKAPRSSALIR